ncbi:type II toxin-antitoxin system VapC family toxin [Marivirga sp.]|uniref:type II toxin-antitoxin system VapC family toxin n=1 Tax=Marivirga sp. TaxID=2018662 RepID=UPI0025CBAAA1|nr:PIN domain-containing protein [Marivirga sp.]
MKNILIDAGPLIALFDRSDQYHLKAISFLKTLERGLITTWPVITETSHMLSFSTKAQANFLEWIERGGLKIYEMEHDHISRLSELTKKYDDVPMDLADASLIVVSEVKGIHQIASIDSDFYIYRDIRNKYLENIFQ